MPEGGPTLHDLHRRDRPYGLLPPGHETHAVQKEIGASLRTCLELSFQVEPGGRLWRDSPYKIVKPLGYGFNTKDYSVGLHFDAYPPEDASVPNPGMEFWITVVRL